MMHGAYNVKLELYVSPVLYMIRIETNTVAETLHVYSVDISLISREVASA